MLTAPSTLTGATCPRAGMLWHITREAVATSTWLRNVRLRHGLLFLRRGHRRDWKGRGESADNLGVKFSARRVPQFAEGFLRRAARAIGTGVGHGVVGVGHVYDSRGERDVVAEQSVW